MSERGRGGGGRGKEKRNFNIFQPIHLKSIRYTNMFFQQVCQAIAVDCANEKARSVHTVSFYSR